MNKMPFLFFMIFFQIASSAQTIRLPYLVGDKYAIVDENQKQILPAEFDDVVIYNDFRVMALEIENAWGIYGLNGEKILDHVIKGDDKNSFKVSKTFGKVSVFDKMYNHNTKDIINNGLLTIADNTLKINYYVNPGNILSLYKPYANTVTRDKKEKFIHHLVDNAIKVGNIDNSIAFIDSIGNEIISRYIVSGYVLSNDFFVINDDNLYSLYNKNKKISKFPYLQIDDSKIKGVFVGQSGLKDRPEDIDRYFTFWNSSGVEIEEKCFYPSFSPDILIIDSEYDCKIFDTTLKEIESFNFTKASFLTLGNKTYLRTTTNDMKYGICSVSGAILLDTIYNYMMTTDSFIDANIKDFHTIYDKNLNVVISMDSVSSLSPTQNDNYFKFSVGWKDTYGLIDQNKNVVIPPIWESIDVSDCGNLVALRKDSLTSIINIKTHEIILEFNRSYNVKFDCQKDKILVSKDSVLVRYDFTGQIVSQFISKRPYKKSKYIVKGSDGHMQLYHDLENYPVLTQHFSLIQTFNNTYSGESVYFCQFEKDTFPKTIIYNENLERINPKGYSIINSYKQKYSESEGKLMVANDADIKNKKDIVRKGVIDFSGKWIIKPFYGSLECVGENLFIISRDEDNSILIYNAQGKRINENKYNIIDKGIGRMLPERILVGTYQDKKYMKKVLQLKNSNLDTNIYIEKFKALGKPIIKYGFIDKKGKLVLEQKYTKAKPFEYGRQKTTVSIRKQGKTFSQIIDIDGNVYFECPFEEMDFLCEGYCQVKDKNDKWAIIDSVGNVKTPFQFTSIERSYQEQFYSAKDSENNFLITNSFKVIPLGTGTIYLKHLNKQYIYSEKSNEVGLPDETKKEIDIYDLEGNFIVKLEDVISISNKFNEQNLSSRYASIELEKSKKPMIYNLMNKRFLYSKN